MVWHFLTGKRKDQKIEIKKDFNNFQNLISYLMKIGRFASKKRKKIPFD
jgi:hypothetical protein